VRRIRQCTATRLYVKADQTGGHAPPRRVSRFTVHVSFCVHPDEYLVSTRFFDDFTATKVNPNDGFDYRLPKFDWQPTGSRVETLPENPLLLVMMLMQSTTGRV